MNFIGNDCYDDSVIYQTTLSMINQIFTVDSYYDPTDIDNPIKQYINIGWKILSTGFFHKVVRIKITPTIVKFLNETTETIFSTEYYSDQLSYTNGYSNVVFAQIDLSYDQNYIEEFIDYQPVIRKVLRIC